MNELHLQDKFLIPFFRDGLGYQEVKANTVTQSLIIEENLQRFISDTALNRKPYTTLLKKYRGDEKKLLKALNRKVVGEFFFKETEDLVDKLCDDFSVTICNVDY